MTVAERIRDIEGRAAAIGISLRRLCRMAGVSHTNIYRWKSGQVSPTEAAWAEACGLLEEALEEAYAQAWAGIQKYQAVRG